MSDERRDPGRALETFFTVATHVTAASKCQSVPFDAAVTCVPPRRHYRVTSSGQVSVDPGACKDSPLGQAATEAARRRAGGGDRDDVRTLARAIQTAFESDMPRSDIAVTDMTEWIETRIRAFLAEREVVPPSENAGDPAMLGTHVIEKRRHGGDRDGDVSYYAVGPARDGDLGLTLAKLDALLLKTTRGHLTQSQAECRALHARVQEQVGQLAALREALESTEHTDDCPEAGFDAEPDTCTCHRRALASDAGKLEAGVIRAAIERRRCHIRMADLSETESLGAALAEQDLWTARERKARAVDALQAAKEEV